MRLHNALLALLTLGLLSTTTTSPAQTQVDVYNSSLYSQVSTDITSDPRFTSMTPAEQLDFLDASLLYDQTEAGAVANTAALAPHFNVSYIVAALRTPKEHLTLVGAHRGLHGEYHNHPIPENSLAAIAGAAGYKIEIAEIDIKLTSDNVPVLLHDQTLGRTALNKYNRSLKFDPFNPDGSPGGSNQPVSVTSSTALADYRLLTDYPQGRVITGSTIPKLSDVLDLIMMKHLNIVIMLDLKDSQAAKECWDVVYHAAVNRKSGEADPREFVVFKPNATIFPVPQDMLNALGATASVPPGVLVMPVYTTSMVSLIPQYNSFWQWFPNALAYEVDVKQYNGNLSSTLQTALSYGRTAGVFQPVPEYGSDEYFDSRGGSCCYTLADVFAPNDTADLRPDYSFLVNEGFQFINSDAPLGLVDQLQRDGRRDTYWLY